MNRIILLRNLLKKQKAFTVAKAEEDIWRFVDNRQQLEISKINPEFLYPNLYKVLNKEQA